MPTAAKLVAAIIFAVSAYYITESIKPNLPEGQPTGYLLPVSILVSVISAWRVMGRLVGKTYWVAVNSGFYALAVSLFFILFVFASSEMIKRSTRKMYDGPTDAIVNMFGIAADYGRVLLTQDTLLLMAAAAVTVGVASEWTHRRWR